MKPCYFCGRAGSDRQQHYLACPLLRRWLGHRFGLIILLPADPDVHEWMFSDIGEGCEGVLSSAAMLDAAGHAFGSLRHGATVSAASLLDARRRHPQLRRFTPSQVTLRRLWLLGRFKGESPPPVVAETPVSFTPLATSAELPGLSAGRTSASPFPEENKGCVSVSVSVALFRELPSPRVCVDGFGFGVAVCIWKFAKHAEIGFPGMGGG